MSKRDYRSPEAAEYRKLYKNKAWQQARNLQLARSPLCGNCKDRGIITQATVVNHVKPHKGDTTLFYASSNLESTCKPCHDGPIQSYERTGVMVGADISGRPTDVNHPWNR